MREATKRQLQELLEQHDREYLRKAKAERDWEVEGENFDRSFENAKENIIEPIMQEFHDVLAEHGIKSRIDSTLRTTQSDGKVVPAKIAHEYLVHTDIEFQGLPGTTPALTFVGESTLGKILIHEDSMLTFIGGHAGVIAECSLDELTTDLVEKHLLAFSGKILKGTGVS